MDTRSKEYEKLPEDWLLGHLVQKLKPKQGSKLPTNGEVIRHYLYLSRNDMRLHKKGEVITAVLKDVKLFWENAGIQTQVIGKSKPPKQKLDKLTNEYDYLYKNKKKKKHRGTHCKI